MLRTRGTLPDQNRLFSSQAVGLWMRADDSGDLPSIGISPAKHIPQVQCTVSVGSCLVLGQLPVADWTRGGH
jgi:hypothetical protein